MKTVRQLLLGAMSAVAVSIAMSALVLAGDPPLTTLPEGDGKYHIFINSSEVLRVTKNGTKICILNVDGRKFYTGRYGLKFVVFGFADINDCDDFTGKVGNAMLTYNVHEKVIWAEFLWIRSPKKNLKRTKPATQVRLKRVVSPTQ